MKKSYLKKKTRVMNDFIYKVWFIYNEYDGNKKLSTPSELSSENMFRLDESIFGVW